LDGTLRALFENSPKKDPSTKSRDYLNIEGRSIRVQVIMELEIELLGSQQVLKSRGAKVLPLVGFEDDFEKPEQDSIDTTADVIVIARGPPVVLIVKPKNHRCCGTCSSGVKSSSN